MFSFVDICIFHRGPGFSSHHPLGGTQTHSSSSSKANLMPSCGPRGHQAQNDPCDKYRLSARKKFAGQGMKTTVLLSTF